MKEVFGSFLYLSLSSKFSPRLASAFNFPSSSSPNLEQRGSSNSPLTHRELT